MSWGSFQNVAGAIYRSIPSLADVYSLTRHVTSPVASVVSWVLGSGRVETPLATEPMKATVLPAGADEKRPLADQVARQVLQGPESIKSLTSPVEQLNDEELARQTAALLNVQLSSIPGVVAATELTDAELLEELEALADTQAVHLDASGLDDDMEALEGLVSGQELSFSTGDEQLDGVLAQTRADMERVDAILFQPWRGAVRVSELELEAELAALTQGMDFMASDQGTIIS